MNTIHAIFLMIIVVFMFGLLGCSSKPTWTHENDHSYKHMTYQGDYGTETERN